MKIKILNKENKLKGNPLIIFNWLLSLVDTNDYIEINLSHYKDSDNLSPLDINNGKLRRIILSLEQKELVSVLSRKRKSHLVNTKDKDYRYCVHMRAEYGIEMTDLEELRKIHNYKCAICKKHESECPKSRLDIDHCHDTGEIRGLLCRSCNTAIGKFKNSPDLLFSAIDYLTRT